MSGAVNRGRFDAFVANYQWKGSGVGTASRLLAMKRPDLFICIDSKNRSELAKAFGVSATSLQSFDGYWDLMLRIRKCPWWRSPQPTHSFERRMWKARIAELQARLDPSAAGKARAEEARQQARETYEDAHGKASETREFTPSPELKSLFREVAKRIHLDFCRDSDDLERRTRLMAEANRAYEAGDAEALQRILNEQQDNAVEGEGIGAELIRIIRQISVANDRVAAIERELAALRQSELALLKKQAEAREKEGRDLLAELATAVREQIERAKKEYESLAKA